jgi:ATP-dependent DNA helicase RecG
LELPLAAIEEAVVNAVYHRSYEDREPIEVHITPDELIVLSYPVPDRSVNMKNLIAGKTVSRRYRNRRIGEFFKELDLTEGHSTGILKILRAIKQNGSPQPEFETDEDRNYFLVRFPVHPKLVRQAESTGSRNGLIEYIQAHDVSDTEWRILLA